MKRHIHWHSIRLKMTLEMVLGIALSSLLLGSIVFFTYERNLKENAENYAVQMVRQINASIDTFFKEIDRISKAPYYDLELLRLLELANESPDYTYTSAEKEYVKSTLFSYSIQKKEISSVFLLDTKGDIVFYQKSSSVNIDTNPYPALLETLEFTKNSFSIIPITYSTSFQTDDRQALSLIRPIISLDSYEAIGYMVVNVNLSAIQSLVQEMDDPKQGRFTILHTNGSLLFQTAPAQAEEPLSDALLQMLDGKSGFGQLTQENSEVMLSYSVSDFTQFFAVMDIRTSVLLHDVSLLRQSYLALSLVIILIGSVIFLVLSLKLTQPIQHMVSLMKNVEDGDFKTRAVITTPYEFAVLAHGFNKMLAYIDEMVIREYQAKLGQRDAEYCALQNQINPHFLYNTLESITMKAELNDDSEVAEMVATLGKLFRCSLSRGKEVVSLAEELTHVSLYVQIQNIRYLNRIVFCSRIDPAFLSCTMPKCTLQPLVENAILHGMVENKPLQITITATQVAGSLFLRITDDGSGAKPEVIAYLEKRTGNFEQNQCSESIGLANVAHRIRLLCGDAYGLSCHSVVGQGFCVDMHLCFDTLDTDCNVGESK